MSAVLTGTAGLTTAGNVALNAANTFTGGVNVAGGTVTLGNASALGDSANTLNVAGTGTVDLNGRAVTVAGLAGSGALTGAAGSAVTLGGSTDTTFSGAIGGAVALNKSGASIQTLAGASTFSGGTTVTGGTLAVTDNAALGTGAVTINGGTVNLTTTTVTNSVTLVNGSLLGGTVDIATALNAQGGTLSSVLAGVGSATGATRVAAGTLALANADALAASTLNLATAKSASTGAGSIPHISMVALMRAANIQMNHVPFRGSGEVMLAFQQGQLQLFTDQTLLIRQYDLHPIAFLTAARNPEFPEVPTMREEGHDLVYTIWSGLYAPAGTPEHVVRVLYDASVKYFSQPEVRARVEASGSELKMLNPKQFLAAMIEEKRQLAELNKILNIKMD